MIRLDKPNGFFAEELDFAAAGLVILVVVTTCFGMEKSACLNLVFTAINVGVLTLAAVFMLVHAQPDLLFIPLPKNVSWTSVLPLVNLTPFLPYGITGLVAGTATCFNAFIGFDMMSMCAEEANDPGKSIPRANVISVLLVTLLLSVSTLALLMYIPWYLLDIGAPFLEAMRNGPGDTTARSVLFYIVGIGCLIGLFSNLLTSALGAPRILYAMGQDGLVFTGFAKVTEPFKTPLIASIPVAVISSLLTMVFSISSLADFMCLGTLIAYSMCSLGVLILRYCPAPEKLIAAVRIPESSVNAKIDQEKEELAIKYGDTIETKDQTSSMKYDFPGASNIDKPGYLKAGWAKLLPSTLVKHMTMNREPGEVCKTNIGFFVLFVLLLHFTVLIAPYTVSSGWTYWRVAGAILWLISLLCCGIVFSMHRQFPGSRPNLFRPQHSGLVLLSFIGFPHSLCCQIWIIMRIAPLFILSLAFASGYCNFINTDVAQTIYADSHIIRYDVEVTLDLPDGPLGLYHYPINSDICGHLSFIEAKSRSMTNFGIEIPKEKIGKRLKFTVSSFFTGVLKPKPAKILQADKQFVEFITNVAYFSTYPTKRVVTTVVLSRGEVLYYTSDIQPVHKTASKIKYGPFENVPPFDKRIARFNYENGSPFLAVTNLERLIEISHWGNIAVENKVSIRNYGARLTGPFSRLDYQRGVGQQISVATIKSVLPASARDIYYRDEIGNISTSIVKPLYSSVEVLVAPRFPLFGGWKTFFILGYNVPAHEYLYRKGSSFGLKMSFMDFLYEELLVDEITLRIVLPETVSNVKVEVPFEVERLPDEVLKTFLDTTGRTVLVIHKKNLIGAHIQDFTVYYDFKMLSMLREPAMLITAFLLLFFVIIIYVRLDFSISEDKMAELQQRAQASVDEILSLQNKRSAIYQTYEDAVSNYKSSKDSDRFKADYRKVEADYKAISQKITSMQSKLREFWTEGADKVVELQKLDQDYHSLLSKGVSLAESVISGKISKPQYQTEDTNLSTKKAALIKRMETIAESL
ncbi:Dolichyl-diphosphooligosaccharide--protein glycosyltransferase subunit [Echinococcus granulosus]|uniref:Dolichyl-diphosphooligosaccharide--protein glycosyltransferase subunit 1 n=1 Tax=Echinococcus granulosus TaxID=6210 RepID=W6UUQ4_ECHGR|nr:Dolichyl-diphosphooligosaccharide--protein glycosyltransferase subunit [Echinococcus granulosus]EUB64396.1 Dolichyl-diphosphooligosaccharide--protein glycosyltransferase subunit [Echinococcus granulosus]